MRAVRLLLVVAAGSLSLGQESRAQQMVYPALPPAAYGAPNGYVYPGYAMPTAYMQPAGPVAAPGAPAPAQPAAAPAAPAAAEGPNACADCFDCTCRIRNWQFFGEYLLLRASNAEVPYAVPINGPIVEGAVPVEVGPVAVLNPGYNSAFRFGFSRALDCAASIGASYTHFESQVSGSVNTTAPRVMRPLVVHPSTLTAAFDGLAASGTYDINFDLAEITYRCTFACGDRWAADFLLGARYGHLEQFLHTEFDFNGTTEVDTSVNFDGGGPMAGLTFERHAACNGFLVYGRGLASFLAGRFNSHYNQDDSFDLIQVSTALEVNRVVPVLEMEVGAGWASQNGLVRFTAGYMVSAWFNTVTTADWVQAVQRANFNNLSDTTVFDGLTARAEIRF